MSQISSLQDLYVDELKDLWSANDQMAAALKKIAPQATNPKLQQVLEKSQAGIAEHTQLLKSLIESHDDEVAKEAVKHTIEEAPARGPVLDAAIIAQYQRMTHYGITGFGTAAAFAGALKLEGDQEKLKASVGDMYGADELMTELAESAVNPEAV